MSEDSKMLPNSAEALPTLKATAPCLRSRSENQKRESRKVSFPEEESHLVTGYLEPANPWEYGESLLYQFDCKYIFVTSFHGVPIFMQCPNLKQSWPDRSFVCFPLVIIFVSS